MDTAAATAAAASQSSAGEPHGAVDGNNNSNVSGDVDGGGGGGKNNSTANGGYGDARPAALKKDGGSEDKERFVGCTEVRSCPGTTVAMIGTYITLWLDFPHTQTRGVRFMQA